MPDVHLVSMTGRDNMAYLLKDIITKCGKNFKTITIVDTGATDDTASLPAKVINLHDWNDDWVKAYMAAISDIPIGDWFLFIDSDEYPNSQMCHGIQNFVNDINSKGFNISGIRGYLHIYGWDGNLEHTDLNPAWRKHILVKKLANTHAIANAGHCSYQQVEKKETDSPAEFFYNHVKSRYTIARSGLCHGFRYPHGHGLDGDTELIEKFKSELNLKTCSDLFGYLEGPMDDSNCEVFKIWATGKAERKEIHDLLIVHKKNQFMPIFCKNDCCKYD